MTEEAREIASYLLVDGENIDRTLGQILEARPRPGQRPRWERVRQFVEGHLGASRALFFLNAGRGLPGPFIQALRLAGYIPVPIEGPPDVKVVDVAINKTLEAIARERPGTSVCLASHDADFLKAMSELAERETGRVAVVGFQEYLSGDLLGLPSLEVWDLEADAKAFDCGPLPRIRVIPIDEFDPLAFI